MVLPFLAIYFAPLWIPVVFIAICIYVANENERIENEKKENERIEIERKNSERMHECEKWLNSAEGKAFERNRDRIRMILETETEINKLLAEGK